MCKPSSRCSSSWQHTDLQADPQHPLLRKGVLVLSPYTELEEAYTIIGLGSAKRAASRICMKPLTLELMYEPGSFAAYRTPACAPSAKMCVTLYSAMMWLNKFLSLMSAQKT